MRRLIFAASALAGARSSVRRRPGHRVRLRRRALSLGIPIAALCAIVLAVHWAWDSGWLTAKAASVTAAVHARTAQAGLSVQQVFVEGRERTQREAILAALEAERGTPMLSIDPAAARERLKALPWVGEAVVERHMPAHLYVRLSERQPMAIWQYRGRHLVIDTRGAAIEGIDPVEHATLPLVVGEDAPEHTAGLLGVLRSQPGLAERVKAAVRVGNRRWNIQLDNGVEVQLPEEGMATAWAQLARLEARHALLQRDVHVIDLRLPDRLVVRTTPGAQPSREAPEIGQST